MSWKLAAVFATDHGAGYFGKGPSNNPDLSAALLPAFGLANGGQTNDLAFENAMYPAADRIHVGAYPDGLVVCDLTIPLLFFDQPIQTKLAAGIGIRRTDHPDLRTTILDRYPNGDVWSLLLHGGVPYWAFSYHRQGQLIRAVGVTNDGSAFEQGEPLDEERDELDSTRDLRQVDGDTIMENLLARIIGPDIETWNFRLSEYLRPKPPSFWRRFWKAFRAASANFSGAYLGAID